jgi:hypothetical protein
MFRGAVPLTGGLPGPRSLRRSVGGEGLGDVRPLRRVPVVDRLEARWVFSGCGSRS